MVFDGGGGDSSSGGGGGGDSSRWWWWCWVVGAGRLVIGVVGGQWPEVSEKESGIGRVELENII